MKIPHHIQKETPGLTVKTHENPPVLVSSPPPQSDGAQALQKLLALVKELPPEVAAEKSLQLTGLIAALERCDEIPTKDLQTSTGLLAQMSDYFRRQSAQEMGKCFLALGILRTRFYRLIGSLEDYAQSLGIRRLSIR